MQILDGLVLTDLIRFIGNPVVISAAMPTIDVEEDEDVLGEMSEEAKQIYSEIWRLKMEEEKYCRSANSRKVFAKDDLARNILLKEVRSRIKFLNAYFSHVIFAQYRLWGVSKKIGIRKDWVVVVYELKGRKKALDTLQGFFN